MSVLGSCTSQFQVLSRSQRPSLSPDHTQMCVCTSQLGLCSPDAQQPRQPNGICLSHLLPPLKPMGGDICPSPTVFAPHEPALCRVK